MAINKVVYGNSTLIDLTEDTVSANNLLAGETAHDRSGAPVVGSVVTAEVVDNLTTQDSTKALSAKQGYVLNQNKVDKVNGKDLSTNDYTNEEKTKLAGISAGAEPNVQSDWKQSDSSSDDFIKNKPTSDIKTSNNGQFTTVTGGLMQSCLVDLEPIQSGSGTPSPQNVRPITGHTAVEVWNHGKNLCNNSTNTVGHYDGYGTYISSNDHRTSTLIEVEPNTTYIGSLFDTSNNSRVGNLVYTEWDENQNFIRQITDETVTTGNTTKYLRVRNFNAQSTLVKTDHYAYQLEEGETATDYEPYNGYTTTINLGGTYYGGTLDAVSGVLTVDTIAVDLGSLNWAHRVGDVEQGVFSADFSTPYKLPTEMITSCYGFYKMFEGTGEMRNAPDGTFGYYDHSNQTSYFIGVKDKRYSDATAFKTAVTGQTVAYELATPFTIQLDPQTLETLVGQNDVFAPLVGQTVEEVEFREVLAFEDVEAYADTKADISAIAPVENGTIASQSYAIGEHFYRNGKFCTAKVSIVQGATFTLNTNYIEGDVASIIFENSWMELGSGSGTLSQYYAISPECTTVNPIIFEGGWELKILTTMSYGINVLDIVVRPALQSVIVGFGKSDTEHHDISFNFKVYGRKIQNSDEYFHEAPYIKLT